MDTNTRTRETCIYCRDRLPLRFLERGDLPEGFRCKSVQACGRRMAREEKGRLAR